MLYVGLANYVAPTRTQFITEQLLFANNTLTTTRPTCRVAMRMRCGEKFDHQFIIGLFRSPLVKEFWKLVNIWGSYG